MSSNESGISRMRNYFFWSVSAVYLCAFASIYVQIPGLYGDDGVLSLRAFAQIDKRGLSALAIAFKQIPSLVWLGPSIGLSLTSTMEIIALIGIVISFLQLVSPAMRDTSMYFALFIAYHSIYQVGQTFLWFQWDSLMLETGALTVLASTLKLPFVSLKGPHEAIAFWLIRWLLFRFMFSAGIVKLTSGCPTWWGLTALDIHFESQCIPTPIAWFAHHFPKWFLRLAVVMTYVIEIVVPFLFFIPIKNLRWFAFVMQILLQLAIMATGNYNFFNLLAIGLCFSILNDSHFEISKRTRISEPKPKLLLPRILQKLFTSFIYFSLIYWTITLFDIKISSNSISSKITFTSEQLNDFIRVAIPVAISLASLSLMCNITLALIRCLILPSNALKRFGLFVVTIIYSSLAIFMFAVSLIPLASLDPTHSIKVWPIIHRWHRSVDNLHIVNSYGLFRHMTGIDGRPELIIEGTNDLKSNDWKEYHFLYKPGDVSQSPKFNMPHQPRLDWQMWFAALDNYQNNPWLLHLSYRLLTAQTEVLDLLDRKRIPFKSGPAYVRAKLYTYRYTNKGDKNWWTRKEEKIYMPPVSKESLKEFLTQNGIETVKKVNLKDKYEFVTSTLKWIRKMCARLTPVSFIYSLLSAAILISSF